MKPREAARPHPRRLRVPSEGRRLLLLVAETQEDIARKLGVTRQVVSQYLSGETRPSLEMAVRIEDAFHIAPRVWCEPPRFASAACVQSADDGARVESSNEPLRAAK